MLNVSPDYSTEAMSYVYLHQGSRPNQNEHHSINTLSAEINWGRSTINTGIELCA